MGLNIPDAATFEAWNRGVITDEQLDALQSFYGDLMRGCEAIGDKVALATSQFRMEHDALARVRWARGH